VTIEIQGIPESNLIAIIDTGSDKTLINRELLDKMQWVTEPGTITRNGLNGTIQVEVCKNAKITFPNSLYEDTVDVEVFTSQNHGAVMCILGTDILNKSIIIYNGPANICTLSF